MFPVHPFSFSLRFCFTSDFAVQGLSSVLKQREFYDPRFITWIESRLDSYVHFCKVLLTFGCGSRVTRLGDLLDFGQLFKAFGNNEFVQISCILRHFL